MTSNPDAVVDGHIVDLKTTSRSEPVFGRIHLYPAEKKQHGRIVYHRLNVLGEPKTRDEWSAYGRRMGLRPRFHASETSARRFSQPDPEVIALLESNR